MKKLPMIAAVLVLLAGSWVAIDGLPALGRRPPTDAETTGTVVPKASARSSDRSPSDVDLAPGRRAVQRAETTAPSEPESASRLVDADGSGLAGVPYWIDERPYRTHPAAAPAVADRTGPDGRFDPPELGPDAWLWFAIDDGVAVAASAERVRTAPKIAVPRRRTVEVEIHALPADTHWRALVFPAWEDDDGDVTHGERHAVRIDDGAPGELHVLRRRIERGGATGAARVRVSVLESWPHAYYCQSDAYVVAPEIQELVDPTEVAAYAGARYAEVPFDVVEDDGRTIVDVEGRWILSEDEGATFSGTFAGGRGRAYLDVDAPRAGRRLTVLLRDGEVFDVELTDDRVQDRETLRLVRGTGRAPVARLDVEEEVLSLESASLRVIVDGRMQRATRFEWFDPNSDEPQVGAWSDGGPIVVQTTRGNDASPRVVLVGRTGRIAVETAGRIVVLGAHELPVLRPLELVARHAEPVGSRRAQLRRQVRLPDLGLTANDGWFDVSLVRLHVVEPLGWRVSWTGSIDVHTAAPETLSTRVPVGAEARTILSVSGVSETTVVQSADRR